MSFVKNKILANKYVLLKALLVIAPVHAYLTFFVFKNSVSGDVTHFSFLILFSCYTLLFACFVFMEMAGPTFPDFENETPPIGVLIFILLLLLKGLILFLFLFLDNSVISFVVNFGAFVLFLFLFWEICHYEP